MVSQVRGILTRSRGKELPGTFNPVVIIQLFWVQFEKWKTIAEYHIGRIAEHCSGFVHATVDFTVASDVSGRLQALKMDVALQERLVNAKAELDRIIGDAKHHPIAYDSTYTTIVQETRGEKHASKMSALVKQAETKISGHTDQYLNVNVVKNGIEDLIERDIDEASVETHETANWPTTR